VEANGADGADAEANGADAGKVGDDVVAANGSSNVTDAIVECDSPKVIDHGDPKRSDGANGEPERDAKQESEAVLTELFGTGGAEDFRLTGPAAKGQQESGAALTAQKALDILGPLKAKLQIVQLFKPAYVLPAMVFFYNNKLEAVFDTLKGPMKEHALLFIESELLNTSNSFCCWLLELIWERDICFWLGNKDVCEESFCWPLGKC
jgi:hypothetical protein